MAYGDKNGGSENVTYDPSSTGVLDDTAMPAQYSVAGSGDTPPGVLGAALNPKPWTLDDSSIHLLLSPEDVRAIDWSGSSSGNPSPDNQSQPPQLDGGGFYTGQTPWKPDPTLSGARSVSDDGLNFIKRQELNPHTGQPYLEVTEDGLNNPTFGYGHFVPSRERAGLQADIDAGKALNQTQALMNRIFADDIRRAQTSVFNRLGSQGVGSLSQSQYDALIADSFNAGGAPALGPHMAQAIHNGDFDAAGQQFDAYWAKDAHTGAWQAPRGLIKRNLQEAKMFNNGDYMYNPSADEINAVVARLGPNPRR